MLPAARAGLTIHGICKSSPIARAKGHPGNVIENHLSWYEFIR